MAGDQPLTNFDIVGRNDPRVTPTPAPLGAQYRRLDTGQSYTKVGIGDLNWIAVGNWDRNTLTNGVFEDNGQGNVATGLNSLAAGVGSLASGENSTALGNGPVASGFFSFAAGDGPSATGDSSCAVNTGTAAGATSFAEGFGTANGPTSHAEGSATANGDTSHAEGTGTANGSFSHAEGSNTQTAVAAANAHAEGNTTIASGVDSHAEGNTTTASGDHSHAEGLNTIASGRGSHAQGLASSALGTGAHASGNSAQALRDGQWSHSSGKDGIASTAGPSQACLVTLNAETPGNVANESVELLIGGTVGDQLTLEDGKAYVFKILVVGNITGGGQSAAFETLSSFLAAQDGGVLTINPAGPIALTQTGHIGAGAASWNVKVTVGAAPTRLVVTFATGVGIVAQVEVTAVVTWGEMLHQ